MKYLIGLVVAVVVVGGAIALSSNTRNSPSTAQESTQTPTTSQAPEQGTLLVVVDTVEVKRSTEASYQSVTRSTPVYEGDSVRTSSQGRARIRLPNGTVTVIEEDSEITITTLKDGGNQSSLKLLVGDVWAKVNRVLGTGDFYEIESDDAVAAVRGTVFRMRHRNKETSVQGIERTVRLVRKNAQGQRQEDTATDLPEGFATDRITRSGAADAPGVRIALRRLTSAERQERVYRRILEERDRLQDTTLPTSTPTRTISPSPSASTLPTATATARPSTSPSSTPTPLPSQTPLTIQTPTPTPPPASPTPTPVTLQTTFPKTINAGETFSLEGSGFTVGRNTPTITSVRVGATTASYSIVGSSSIFVTPSVSSGTYDVSVITTEGKTVTLTNAITIR